MAKPGIDLDLAVVGNCAIASLVSKTGRHLWFGFPRLDADPAFCALLGGHDPQRGFMDVVLADAAEWTQSYIRNTAILQTTGTDRAGGSLKITDFAPRAEKFGRSYHPALLVRRIEPIAGRPRISVRIRPMFEYGATAPTIATGSNHIRYVGPSATLRVTADMPLSYITEETEFVLDRPLNLFIGADETLPENPDTQAQSSLSETENYWRGWVRGLSIPFEWQEEVIRAAITLKLCSYEDTGAIVAALTTSIPEAANTVRNWDYRYCWIRDAYFTVGALNRLGATRTMEGFIRFVLDAVLSGSHPPAAIPPMFTITGRGDMTETVAAALPGYHGMGPVRVGNAASTQVQNDVYGSIVLTAAQMFWDQRLSNAGDAKLYEQLRPVGDIAVRCAFEPDAGPWEYRGRAVRHTYSVAKCWAAAHRLAMIAEKLGKLDEAQEWRTKAARIRRELLDRATTRSGWISGVLDAEVADASTLLLTEIGLLTPTDPRIAKTLEVIEKRLMRNGFIFRYDEADDFGKPETAFLICTFWYCDTLGLAGRKEEARALFENAFRCRNSAGLLSEDVDPVTRTLWGNFPQAYSHVGLIHSASRLSRGWEEALWRAS
jgi:GH15 family glucan-1,4-alpha-glucosidase